MTGSANAVARATTATAWRAWSTPMPTFQRRSERGGGLGNGSAVRRSLASVASMDVVLRRHGGRGPEDETPPRVEEEDDRSAGRRQDDLVDDVDDAVGGHDVGGDDLGGVVEVDLAVLDRDRDRRALDRVGGA